MTICIQSVHDKFVEIFSFCLMNYELYKSTLVVEQFKNKSAWVVYTNYFQENIYRVDI